MADDDDRPDDDASDGSDAPDDNRSSSDGSDAGGSGRPEKNALEWAVSGVGAAIVLFVIGFFVYEWVAGASGPADLVVSLGEATTDSLTVEVPVEVRNRGERVAEAVVVEVCAGPEACAEVTFDYVPYQSRASGRVGLTAPLRAPLTTRVVSYVDP